MSTDSRGASFRSFLEKDLEKELLRFTTAGSVDDGKSTLIGRLLHDSKAVYEDQLASVRTSPINRSSGPIDFALLTDGLRAEREQGITIDVAYRYFSTARRKFIIADTPGHEQYTRNMATGASTADLAVVLIDATKGLLPQTRRHAYIASLLGIPNVVAAVNKMDLVDYREDVFLRLQKEFFALAEQLGIPNVYSIPISALVGENIVSPSERMPWCSGPTLLQHLETVPLGSRVTMEEVRFPVQYVVRPDQTFRGFAGQLASGVIRPGDRVVALPSGQTTRVQAIVTYEGEQPEAFHPMSVTLRLKDEIDLSRGDILVSPENPPRVSRLFEAMVVWLHPKGLELGRSYLVKHAGRWTRAKAVGILYRVNINTLDREPARQLQMNDIAAVGFESNAPLFLDAYDRNRTTGSFILIDPISNATLGAGMIREGVSTTSHKQDRNLRVPWLSTIDPSDRYKRHRHYPGVILVEGRPALASLLERILFAHNFEVLLLDRDELSSDSFQALLSVTQLAGLVVIYSFNSLGPEESQALATLDENRCFDLAAFKLPDDDDQAARQIVALVRSLRVSENEENSKKVN
jgi:sulfate adenylyltransferase large subunit